MVYLLHFSEPLHHARHYLGWCPDDGLDARLAEHRAGAGARITQVVVALGIGLELVRTWPGGSRKFERKLKNYRKATAPCPYCRAEVNAKARTRRSRAKAPALP